MSNTVTTSTAVLATPNASRYLQQLCKHFAHKIPASFDTEKGRIDFPFGTCHLTAAGETLTLTAETAEPETLERLEGVIASHLERFAFREELAISWTR